MGMGMRMGVGMGSGRGDPSASGMSIAVMVMAVVIVRGHGLSTLTMRGIHEKLRAPLVIIVVGLRRSASPSILERALLGEGDWWSGSHLVQNMVHILIFEMLCSRRRLHFAGGNGQNHCVCVLIVVKNRSVIEFDAVRIGIFIVKERGRSQCHRNLLGLSRTIHAQSQHDTTGTWTVCQTNSCRHTFWFGSTT